MTTFKTSHFIGLTILGAIGIWLTLPIPLCKWLVIACELVFIWRWIHDRITV